MKLAVLALLSTVASVVDFGTAEVTVDKGLINGLREGDRGVVFYLLSNGEREVRFDRGHAEVINCGDFSCRVRTDPALRPSPGYWIEFLSADERTGLQEMLRLAKERIAGGELESADRYLARLSALSSGSPELTAELADLRQLLDQARQPPPPPPNPVLVQFEEAVGDGDPSAATRLYGRLREREVPAVDLQQAEASLRELWSESMLEVPAQSWEFGLERHQARFFNQTPRFRRRLEEFWIDRRPAEVSGVRYAQAEEYCRSRGKRLPTEFEWDAAVRRPGFQSVSGLSEWTASWYQPYPGNSEPEPEYGEQFKVVRGYDDQGQLRPDLRFLLAPDEVDPQVGFRCAADPPWMR